MENLKQTAQLFIVDDKSDPTQVGTMTNMQVSYEYPKIPVVVPTDTQYKGTVTGRISLANSGNGRGPAAKWWVRGGNLSRRYGQRLLEDVVRAGGSDLKIKDIQDWVRGRVKRGKLSKHMQAWTYQSIQDIVKALTEDFGETTRVDEAIQALQYKKAVACAE